MSWSIEVTGTKEGVTKKVTEQLDQIAKNFGEKEEAKDVLAAKERILSLIGVLDLSSDGYTDWNCVKVNANGSHAVGSKGLNNASMQISVQRMSIALDPTA